MDTKTAIRVAERVKKAWINWVEPKEKEEIEVVESLTLLIEIAKNSSYHINHATCHECPCKLNFDKMKSELARIKDNDCVTNCHELCEIARRAGDVEGIEPYIADNHFEMYGENYGSHRTAVAISQYLKGQDEKK